jgi:hypothetical protein
MNGKNTLTVCGALVASVVLAVAAGACGGGGQEDSAADEQVPESQPFATDPFELEPGLAIATMTHYGEGDFVVTLLSTNQEETERTSGPIELSGGPNDKPNDESNAEVAIALADETGPVQVSRAVNAPVEGRHVLDVKADGPWEIEIEQPRPSSAPKTTSFSGGDDAATPIFWLSGGLKTITMNTQGKGTSALSLLDKDGNAVSFSSVSEGNEQSDPRLPSTASATVDVPQDGIYLFDVRSDGLWKIEIAEGEQPDRADAEPPRGTIMGGVPSETFVGALLVIGLAMTVLFLGSRGRV